MSMYALFSLSALYHLFMVNSEVTAPPFSPNQGILPRFQGDGCIGGLQV